MEPLLEKMRKAKIYYIPGLISLVFFPLTFYILNYNKPFETSFSYVEPQHEKNKEDANNHSYTGEWLMQSIKKKKIVPFELSGDADSDSATFTLMRLVAYYLKKTENNNWIVRIHLSANTTYGEFVTLLNYMSIDDIARYAVWEDNFYIIGDDDSATITGIKERIFITL